MRNGSNPAKSEGQLPPYGRHRVIVPVYIPNQDGYFKDALAILRLCLDSLYLTTKDKAAITVVSNGCMPEAVALLQRYFSEGKCDQLVLNQQNRGKVDAVVSVMRGCFEELLTVSDSDVLFRPGWLEAVEHVFSVFPEAGFVSPFPNPSLLWHQSSATILSVALSNAFHFRKVVPDADLDRFARSVGTPDYFAPRYREAQLVVERHDSIACVGAGHFVFTVRRAVVSAMPPGPSLTRLGGKPNPDEEWLDAPADRLGYWRLATDHAYVCHMGNRLEAWMKEESSEVTQADRKPVARPAAMPRPRPPVVSVMSQSTRRLWVRVLKRLGCLSFLFRRRGFPAHLPRL